MYVFVEKLSLNYPQYPILPGALGQDHLNKLDSMCTRVPNATSLAYFRQSVKGSCLYVPSFKVIHLFTSGEENFYWHGGHSGYVTSISPIT